MRLVSTPWTEPLASEAASGDLAKLYERIRAASSRGAVSMLWQSIGHDPRGLGERHAIVLQRLAHRQSRDASEIDLTDSAVAGDSERSSWDGADKITIDLTRFEGVDDDEARVLHRYVNTIQVQRQDFNGRMLTIRRDDLRAIAAAAGIDVDALVRRLDDLQLRRA